MKQEEKRQLAKLAKLENKKTEAFLLKKAQEISAHISSVDNNDEAFELLDLLSSFAYRVPDEVIKLGDVILTNQHDERVYESEIGSFRGKHHRDVVLKILEIINQIRYAKPDEILSRLKELVKDPDKNISGKSLEILKNLAKYDYFILTKTKIGYGAQRKVLDFILAWSTEEKLINFDFLKTIARELLSSEIEGTEWVKEDTLTFHSAAIAPTEFLKKIRRETIDLLKNLYRDTDDIKIKLQIVHLLEEGVRSPGSVVYGEDLVAMLREDGDYITHTFRELLLESGTSIKDNLSIATEIDKLLYWFQRHSKLSSPEAAQLRKDILADPTYSLFRILASDDITYREEEGWDTAEKKRDEKIQDLINSISQESIPEWDQNLNLIASQNRYVENWHFLHFKNFLRKLSDQKPELAIIILLSAFEQNKPLVDFVGAFLDGFRDAKSLKNWDLCMGEIIKTQNPFLVSAIAYSLIRVGDIDLREEIREVDLNLLENIVEKKNDFNFLQSEKEKNYVLHHSIINALTRNFQLDPKRMEDLIITEIKSNPDYNMTYFRELPFAVWKKYIDFSELSPEGMKFIKERLIDISDLDWETQQLLLDLGKKDLQIILDIFVARIKKHEAQSEKKRDLDRSPHYESIPYHLNDELRKHIAEHPQYKEIISKYLEASTPEWSIYNWDLGHLMQRIGTSFEEIVTTLVEKGDTESLRRAVYLMDSIEGGHMDLCIKIIGKTDDAKVINKIDALLYSTGVVSGEDGIARAYVEKAKQLEQYKSDPNPRIKAFVDRMIASFKNSAEKEFQRAEEGKQIRKIEFEG